jgi:predicted nucleotidyltransferase
MRSGRPREEAVRVKPSEALEHHRPAVRSAAARHRLANPRVFGSVARGTDGPGSDLDLLVEPLPRATLFDVGGFQDEVEELLGEPVDVRTPGDLPAPMRDRVVSEAKPL